MEENVRVCDHCDCELCDGEGIHVGDDLLCEDCVEDYCVRYDHCGNTIYVDDSVQDDDICLCQDCFDDHYYRCDCCSRIVRSHNIYWRNDIPYCEHCYDDFDDEIEEYSYKPEPIFYGEGKRYLGVELEVDNGGKSDENAESIKEIGNYRHDHIYIKSDGSLDDGFEIVSHPMTLTYHMENMDCEGVLGDAVRLNYRSHQTNTSRYHYGRVPHLVDKRYL